jgi:hypothetical protein
MLTVFACINAVGEAVIQRRNTREALNSFYTAMEDKASWVDPPQGVEHDDSRLFELLLATRHSLNHALSMPPGIMLLPSRAARKPASFWGLYVLEFIQATEETVRRITREHHEKLWDPAKTETRGVAGTMPVPLQGLLPGEEPHNAEELYEPSGGSLFTGPPDERENRS